MSRLQPRIAALLTGLALLAGCAAEDGPATGPEEAEAAGEPALGEVTLQSDDSTATVPPLCVGDVPEDPLDCTGREGDEIGRVELDPTRKAVLQLPAELVESGYRVRLNGTTPPPGKDEVLTDQSLPFRVPEEVVAAPGGTTVTVEALSGATTPKALWRFVLDDPAGPPG